MFIERAIQGCPAADSASVAPLNVPGSFSVITRDDGSIERFLEKPAGTYTWIPFGGGVRRCLGASFAQFEMAAVLRVLARRCARLEPDALVPERTARRAITPVPAREGSVVVG